mmetsp:Transcript_8765/g.29198  ORF Transcript_8765/g.29198 Transcript_8765/m.29198 type:complete len:238 (+) Transcript_8765:1303-2016(+)
MYASMPSMENFSAASGSWCGESWPGPNAADGVTGDDPLNGEFPPDGRVGDPPMEGKPLPTGVTSRGVLSKSKSTTRAEAWIAFASRDSFVSSRFSSPPEVSSSSTAPSSNASLPLGELRRTLAARASRNASRAVGVRAPDPATHPSPRVFFFKESALPDFKYETALAKAGLVVFFRKGSVVMSALVPPEVPALPPVDDFHPRSSSRSSVSRIERAAFPVTFPIVACCANNLFSSEAA